MIYPPKKLMLNLTPVPGAWLSIIRTKLRADSLNLINSVNMIDSRFIQKGSAHSADPWATSMALPHPPGAPQRLFGNH